MFPDSRPKQLLDSAACMDRIKNISPWQFACFRMLFGSYLVVHFAGLLPYGGELFSGAGLLADPKLNFTFGVLPNPLEHFHSPAFAVGFIGGLLVLSLAFTFGLFRRTVALLLWFGWACLFNRNNLILNPGLPYVGLLLLLCAIVPPGEPLSVGRGRNARGWQMPAMIYWCAWFLLATGYTYSGFYKLFSPSWTDGSALLHLANNPLARPGLLRDLLLALPENFLKLLTWGALLGEILALPLSFHRRGRLLSWLWLMGMHLGILMVVDFADLTFGMVMIHLFTFDPAWLPARQPVSQTMLLFDGDCGLCHRTVQFFLAEDRGGVLRFAPLRGANAAPILKRHSVPVQQLTSLILVEGAGSSDEEIFQKSTAVLRALGYLGGFWRVVGWMQAVPVVLRDGIYDWVAQRRHQWFGRGESCAIPSATARERLLA